MELHWLFLLFWALCTHAQLIPFYHPFYPDVTRFFVLKVMESWAGPGNEATLWMKSQKLDALGFQPQYTDLRHAGG